MVLTKVKYTNEDEQRNINSRCNPVVMGAQSQKKLLCCKVKKPLPKSRLLNVNCNPFGRYKKDLSDNDQLS